MKTNEPNKRKNKKATSPLCGRRVKRVSFNEVVRLTRAAVRKMRTDGFTPDVLVGVGRGGWTPAVIVSNLVGNKRLYSVKCEYYDAQDNPLSEPRISQTVGLQVKGKKVLIIDEVADSGGSLRAIAKHFKTLHVKEFRFLVLHWKTCAAFTPDYWGERAETEAWLRYPWDVE